MERKQIFGLGGAALAGCALALPGFWVDEAQAVSALALPFRLAGGGLRWLSLSGFWGNLAAWLIVAGVCALPLIPLALARRRRSKAPEDFLAWLAVPELFALLWFLVNPTHLGGSPLPADLIAAFYPLAVGGTLLSTLLAWLILGLLRGLEGAPQDRLAAAFRPLLTVCALLLALFSACGRTAELAGLWTSVTGGNTASGDPLFAAMAGIGPSYAPLELTLGVLVLRTLLRFVPDLLAALTLLWGARLAGELGRAAFGDEAVALCGETAALCRRVAQATVLLALGANLLQLFLLPYLYSSSFSLDLPLFSLALSAGLYLLCRCLQRGRDLQADSDSII